MKSSKELTEVAKMCTPSYYSVTSASMRSTYPGALAIGVDGDGGFVDALHEPVRQLIFQSGVELNLKSVRGENFVRNFL